MEENRKPQDCMDFGQGKRFHCNMNVVEGFDSNKRYNCKINGVCAHFKSQKQHEKEVAERKEQRDKEEYIRLKKKFE